MPQEHRLILKNVDRPGYSASLESYGDYAVLRKALALGPKTLPDGKYTVEFVECLASCGTAPVMMVNEEFHEKLDQPKAEEVLAKCK